MEIFRLFGRIMVDNDEANQSIQRTGQEAEKSGGMLDKLGGFAKGLGGILGGALLAGATAAATGLVALGNVASNMQNALGNLQAKTGASDDEMKNLESTLSNIYAAGYGESFDDISEAMATVMQNTKASGEELERITKTALGLSETFDMDVNESTRTASMMMKQFGITSDQAFNLMIQGTQQGANKNGDLLDTLNEYAPLFSSIGLDAERMMDILVSGAENGAWSIDKVGDAVKEMNIRMKDGNDKTKQALTDLGLNADSMTNAFARGGEEGANAFNEIMIALANVEDPLLKNQMGVAIMGTMYEDLESTVIDSLAEVGNHVDMNADSLSKLNGIKYDTLGEALTGIGKSALMGILQPFNEHVMPIINSFANQIAEQMPNVRETMSNVFGAIFDVIGNVFSFFTNNILPIFNEVYEYVSGYFPVIRQVAEDVFNAVVEVVKTVWNVFSENILPVLKEMFEWIKGHMPAIRETFQTVFNNVKDVISGVWNFIKENLLPILTRFYDWAAGKIPTVQNIFEKTFGIIKNVVEIVWDLFENFLLPILKGLWEFIEPVFPVLGGIVEKAFNVIIGVVETTIDVFEKVTGAIKIAIDWLTFWDKEDPKPKNLTVTQTTKYNTSGSIPQYAIGTNHHPGGLAIVGEQGPELVSLPTGSKVSTANETRNKVGNNINFEKMFEGANFIVRNDYDIKEIGEELGNQFSSRLRVNGVK